MGKYKLGVKVAALRDPFVNKWIIILLIIYQLITIKNVYAEEEVYCDRKNLGWHFYCEKLKEVEEEQKIPEPTPEEKLKEIQEELQRRKVKAVMNPTEENVASYIEYQNEQTKRSAIFSRVWRRVQWKNPNLDYKVRHPSTTEGISVEKEENQKKMKQAMSELNKRYGIFYFYRGEDAYSKKFSRIVRMFVRNNQLEMRAVSLDGVIDEEFKNNVTDKGQIEKLGVRNIKVPAVMLFDVKTNQLIPVSTGMIGINELEERIYLLTSVKEVENEDY